MSRFEGHLRSAALGLAAVGAVAGPAFALALPDLESLSHLERGRWRISDAEGAAERSLCLAGAADFVQLEHRGISCGQEVLASEPGAATVRYECPGRGFGQTNIRVETPRLARIDTQGLLDGRPFAYRVEVRRVGAC